MEVIAMLGPLDYDLAQQHISELLAERAMDRLAAQLSRPSRARGPRIDIRRVLPPLHPKTGSAQARA